MPSYRAAFALIFFALAFSVAGYCQAPPTADAYITNISRAANFGGSSLLPVQLETTTYIRLNLGAIPASAQISKATLRLYVNAVAVPGAFDVYAVNSKWDERSLTAANAPSLGASATGGRPIAITSLSVNQFVLVDITSLAQAWLDGSITNYGVALALTSAEGSFAFDSKESKGHYPELEVLLAGSRALALPSANARENAIVAPAGPVAVSSIGAPASGSSDYIDNGTALQTQANFNIDGTGSAANFNAASQYQLGGLPVLSNSGPANSPSLSVGQYAGSNNMGSGNVFLGTGAGQSNTTGAYNVVLGTGAAQGNQDGSYSVFIGSFAGAANTSSWGNTFLGYYSGYGTTSGSYNTFFGHSTGISNTTGYYNVFLGALSGSANTTGIYNSFIGVNSGQKSTGNYNTFIGGASGQNVTIGQNNTFIGLNAGWGVAAGSQNTMIGFGAGQTANPAGSNNLYLANQGQSSDNGIIRIGDSANQTAAYIAGVNGTSTSSGVPVFIDANGKLGTGGGSVDFLQITGTVSSPQLAGAYGSQVAMTNSGNTFNGTFSGNGAGLTGVASGLNWNIVTKTADYTVLWSDFANPTKTGNYLILLGTTSHTFTLPNPPPPNGYCIAIGDNADPGINSNQNAYLTVSPNGVNMDTTSSGNTVTPTLARHTSYLFCSDGTNYFRLGYQQNGVSQIGPWIKTVDTGTQNAMQTTFRNGMDFGLSDGSFIFLQPKFANIAGTVTLNVNGLGARQVLRYGLHALSPGDLQPNTFAVLIYNSNGSYWQLVNPQTAQGLNGTIASLGGSLITAGTCSTGTVAVTGATVGHPVTV
nr:hypothetical protein Hi04_10k_c4773_00024 [uncultured bacterium]